MAIRNWFRDVLIEQKSVASKELSVLVILLGLKRVKRDEDYMIDELIALYQMTS